MKTTCRDALLDSNCVCAGMSGEGLSAGLDEMRVDLTLIRMAGVSLMPVVLIPVKTCFNEIVATVAMMKMVQQEHIWQMSILTGGLGFNV